jgi:ABC-type branched-subunit amino acid transport system substrate-binding protein
MLDVALERTTDRPELHRRLVARRVLAAPDRERRRMGPLAPAAGDLLPWSRASAYRFGLLLPDSGSYQPYGRAVRLGFDAALADANSVTDRPIEVSAWNTGDDDPPRAVAALDSALAVCGALVGDLLSVPTQAIATGARLARVPLVSPSATHEGLGAIPGVFQIGPSAARRGERLANAVFRFGPRPVGILLSSDAGREAFADGFAAAAESLGVAVVWRDRYPPGATDFRGASRAMAARKVEVLLWDGEPRELDALLRQLSKDKVSVLVCGGEALTPEQHHAEARLLLEGAIYVSEDWRLPQGIHARLDSLAHEAGEERGHSLYVRGYLAGRVLSEAVMTGALSPGEIAARLDAAREPLPAARSLGFLDCLAAGARLPVLRVERGQATPLQ